MRENEPDRRDIDELYKTVNVQEMFETIVPTYDFLNHFFSFNVDRAWRRKMIREARLPAGASLLDVCTGTADVAVDTIRMHPDARVVGIDFAEPMLERGRRKLAARSMLERVSLQAGNAEALPCENDAFDAATVAFGLRNVADRRKAVAEMARCVRSGGKVLILEFSPPPSTLFGRIYRAYLRHIMPAIGERLSNYETTYTYLYSSINAFLKPDELARMMRDCGLEDVRYHRLTGGIAYLHCGTRR